jgi:hypothetical protein
MKQFNRISAIARWGIAISCTVILGLLLNSWIQYVNESPIWAAGIFVMVPVIQFFSTPLFTLIGIYTYYSPMVVSLGSNDRVIDLHNGTSFDYLLEMRHVKPGLPWKKRMLGHYLAALQHIIDKIESGELPSSVTVQGSSYFLSRSSAERLGFSVSGTSVFVKFNILLNYLDLLWTYSLTNGRLTFPNMANIQTVSISGEGLVKQKQLISGLVERLG